MSTDSESAERTLEILARNEFLASFLRDPFQSQWPVGKESGTCIHALERPLWNSSSSQKEQFWEIFLGVFEDTRAARRLRIFGIGRQEFFGETVPHISRRHLSVIPSNECILDVIIAIESKTATTEDVASLVTLVSDAVCDHLGL